MAATLDPGLILVIIADSTDRLQGKSNNITCAGSSASSRNEGSCPLDDRLPLAYDRHWPGSKG